MQHLKSDKALGNDVISELNKNCRQILKHTNGMQ